MVWKAFDTGCKRAESSSCDLDTQIKNIFSSIVLSLVLWTAYIPGHHANESSCNIEYSVGSKYQSRSKRESVSSSLRIL